MSIDRIFNESRTWNMVDVITGGRTLPIRQLPYAQNIPPTFEHENSIADLLKHNGFIELCVQDTLAFGAQTAASPTKGAKKRRIINYFTHNPELFRQCFAEKRNEVVTALSTNAKWRKAEGQDVLRTLLQNPGIVNLDGKYSPSISILGAVKKRFDEWKKMNIEEEEEEEGVPNDHQEMLDGNLYKLDTFLCGTRDSPSVFGQKLIAHNAQLSDEGVAHPFEWPCGTFMQQPFGSQSWPDFIIKIHPYFVLFLEAKSCVDSYRPKYNSGGVHRNMLYVFSRGKNTGDKTTYFMGNSIVRKKDILDMTKTYRDELKKCSSKTRLHNELKGGTLHNPYGYNCKNPRPVLETTANYFNEKLRIPSEQVALDYVQQKSGNHREHGYGFSNARCISIREHRGQKDYDIPFIQEQAFTLTDRTPIPIGDRITFDSLKDNISNVFDGENDIMEDDSCIAGEEDKFIAQKINRLSRDVDREIPIPPPAPRKKMRREPRLGKYRGRRLSYGQLQDRSPLTTPHRGTQTLALADQRSARVTRSPPRSPTDTQSRAREAVTGKKDAFADSLRRGGRKKRTRRKKKRKKKGKKTKRRR